MSTSTTTPFTIVNDGTDEASWLASRRPFLGASQSAAVLGLSPYMTPFDVWKSMQPDNEPWIDTRFTTWGKRLEAVIAEWAAVDYPDTYKSVQPSPGLMVSTKYPWLSATPDRMVGDDAVMEVKNGGEYTKANWYDESGAEVAPIQYEVQTVQQLIVSGRSRGYIQGFMGGNDLLAPRPVFVDPEFEAQLAEITGEWYEKYYIGQTPPPLTERDDFKAAYGLGSQAKTITANRSLLALIRERAVDVQPVASRLKKRDDEIKGTLKEAMQDATAILDDAGTVLVTWAGPKGPSQAKPKLDEVLLRADHPELNDLLDGYSAKPDPTRTMTFTKDAAKIVLPALDELPAEVDA